MPTRADALALLFEHTQTEPLRRHGLAVEAVLRLAATRLGADADLWGMTGLLHDFDYEGHPSEHPFWGRPILEAAGYPPELIRAIQGHAVFTGVGRDTDLARWLFGCDELTGFVVAVALVHPTRSVAAVEPRSVRRKLRDRGFARSVSRSDIEAGMADLAFEPDVLIQFVIDGLATVAPIIGLGDGRPQTAAEGPHLRSA
ncbi:MAG TPA: HD domain-containing protein [Candidatus Micrarchaeia archaeon]|nr:HD domain-containing protein [Candidatus Micrarchaeia archaeon]